MLKDSVLSHVRIGYCAVGATLAAVSTKPSFPGKSGRSLVMRAVSFTTSACALVSASNGSNNIEEWTSWSFFSLPLVPTRLSGYDAEHDLSSLMRRTSKHLVGGASFFQREHSSYVRN